MAFGVCALDVVGPAPFYFAVSADNVVVPDVGPPVFLHVPPADISRRNVGVRRRRATMNDD